MVNGRNPQALRQPTPTALFFNRHPEWSERPEAETVIEQGTTYLDEPAWAAASASIVRAIRSLFNSRRRASSSSADASGETQMGGPMRKTPREKG